ncbi:hypothetical protein [Acetobacter aceti]|nr:hypothetical protein [Acetobacter aceti]
MHVRDNLSTPTHPDTYAEATVRAILMELDWYGLKIELRAGNLVLIGQLPDAYEELLVLLRAYREAIIEVLKRWERHESQTLNPSEID